ncbi:hypothetical protein [uncultured Acinetobacter sp.]|uniref:hypothetical protein n=1 Tax=uncultured Acinetobacter sp. TaxID=165433 RepID=UPI0025F09C2E|nr:hypothetical protein [uncultured Acinetobacter sp.]
MSGRFVVRAGQHVFKTGEKVELDIPILPFYAGNPLCPLKSRFGENTVPENKQIESKENIQQTPLENLTSLSSITKQNSPAEPYPNSKGDDVNTPPVNKLPSVQLPDFSKRQGHICSKIPAFIDIQKRFESLSGSYCRTKADGSYDAVTYDSKQHDNNPNFKVIEIGEKKQAVPFYNYSEGFQNIDIEFDPKKNILVCSRRIIFVPKCIKYSKDKKEYPYENQKTTKKEGYLIEPREVTKDIINFIQQKQIQINALINYAGYYLSPSDCNAATGCSCIVPVILKVSMQVQRTSERQHPHAKVINLFPSATRADAENWGEVALKDEKYIPSPQPRFENGSIVVPPSGPAIKVERTKDSTAIFLHEIAHLFGFPDEYFEGGGAVHKMYIKSDTQTVDIHFSEPANDWKRKVDGHLMSTAIEGQMPIIPPYYYERFRQYFENKTGVRWEIKKLSA